MSAYSQKRTFGHFFSRMDSLHHERYALGPGRECVERRLAAILVADVVGYSRLMGEDEAGTLSSLKVQEGLGMRTGPLLGDVWQVFGQGLSQRTNVLDLNAAAPADDLNASVHTGERPFDKLLGRYPRLEAKP